MNERIEPRPGGGHDGADTHDHHPEPHLHPADLHVTGGCPLGHRCESCGAERDDLAVGTAETALGVLCLTLCPRCAESAMAPPVAVATAARLVGQHCMHLGITVDDMAALLEGGPQ